MVADIWQGFKNFLLNEFGIPVNDGQVELFKRFLDELLVWGKKFNITKILEPVEIIYLHFADSLAGAAALRKMADGSFSGSGFSAVDVGTGAGFPGLPLKILFPQMELLLVESVKKKAVFLEHIIGALGVENTTVACNRAEDIVRDAVQRGKYDFSFARALKKFDESARLCLPFLKNGGTALFWQTEKSFGARGHDSRRGYRLKGDHSHEAHEAQVITRYKLPMADIPRLIAGIAQ
ncbi:MAG: 16S rRNA (guanine(527)-N(7))-methyltransferase RsmG [Elusimicrobia bacterium]|nr:16S rRNA (guanine(527)-N(7))-methyltransferase RsmG [Elusimicrobiota bacterium]